MGFPFRTVTQVERLISNNANYRTAARDLITFDGDGINQGSHLRKGNYVFASGRLNDSHTRHLPKKTFIRQVINKVINFFRGNISSNSGSHTNVRNLED